MDVLYNLSILLLKQKEYALSLQIREALLNNELSCNPPNKIKVSTYQQSIGVVYLAMKDGKKALPFLIESNNIIENEYPDVHKCRAISYQNLACAYELCNEYEKSLLFYKKTEHIYGQLIINNNDCIYIKEKIIKIEKMLEKSQNKDMG